VRLYITVWETATNERNYEFTGTQADNRAVVRFIKDEGDSVVRSNAIDVPTDKAGLIAFLNTYRVRPDLDGEKPSSYEHRPDDDDETEHAPVAEEGRLAL
jgi:hypothetical protein